MFIWKAWKRVVSITLTIILALCMFPLAEAEEQQPLASHRVQLGGELLEVLECDEEALMSGNYPDSTTQYSCLVWIDDIDYEIPIQEGLVAALATQGITENVELPYTVSVDKDGNKDIVVNIDMDADPEYVQAYVETKRDKANEMYLEQNTDFAERVLGESVTYISGYSPCVFVELTIDQIAELLDSEEVQRIDYCDDSTPVLLSDVLPFTSDDITNLNDVKMESTSINITKQLYNVSGWYVKIGQLEIGCPRASSVAKNSNHTYGSDDERNHADKVYTVMHEIAPNATYYASGVDNLSGQDEFYEGIEWLLGQHVDIINISMGYLTYNVYDTRSRWMDHIAFNHDVHVVMAAGNDSSDGVVSPAMANNVITVGNVEDNFNLRWSSSYNKGESTYSSRMCKPDISAPGCYPTGSGTSYSAPMIAGTIALMCNKWPTLKSKQHLVKMALTVGTSTSKSYDTNTGVDSNFRKYGSGVLDARRAFYIINNNRYVSLAEVSSSNTTATYTFNVTSTSESVRVGVTYTNRIVFPSSDHSVGGTPSGTIGNVSIEVRSPSNTLVKSITSQYANVKVFQFNPSDYGTGTYTVIIKQLTPQSSGQVTKFSWGWR